MAEEHMVTEWDASDWEAWSASVACPTEPQDDSSPTVGYWDVPDEDADGFHAELLARRRQLRRQALDDMLAAVADSRWADHLVLRGSILLKGWYGDAAREPADLDFVVTPHTWLPAEPRSTRMLDDIAAAAAAVAAARGVVRIDGDAARREEVWSYDRAPGMRLMLPWDAWHAEEPFAGAIRLDFVFKEPLPEEPRPTAVSARGAGDTCRLLAATPEQSLAWKLLWMMTDQRPDGKDLYDAMLLAEATPLPLDLLMRTLVATDPQWAGRRFEPKALFRARPDVRGFRESNPEITDSTESLGRRLAAALAPTFAESAVVPPGDGYTRRVRYLGSWIARARELLRDEGVEAVLVYLSEESVEPAEAVVILREAVGADRCTVADATATLIEFLARVTYREFPAFSHLAALAENALTTLRQTV
ncbi:nucleotidyl transferase AbiEii/AbiGii toxin family protein [Yinghuangia soli]|uniref:Nucleotidyl transferase AbiEii/AbiGii toxin family protein n=1 Tax=Yinghuangia soli TaxID=2908204 RepID=A0AA41Q4G1_9ACTN|nr:nucleotidyl transferase AbiEii/AbiGii toxin family protein [Yinghuangia soli]MCF2531007.1 nucleotidyl transferase AbiEii/AbiGii toxin family protein [Yinghuangia soli]